MFVTSECVCVGARANPLERRDFKSYPIEEEKTLVSLIMYSIFRKMLIIIDRARKSSLLNGGDRDFKSIQ